MKKQVDAEDIELVFSGRNYFEVLRQIIDESKETLHLQTYIFTADETGLQVIDSLKKAASRGVNVYLLSDAYGSFPFSSDVAKDLVNSGIRFRLYSPFFSSESIFFGRRLHHKIVVADKHIALIGGINIANKYNANTEEEAWLDYAVLTRGKACEYLDLLCGQIYKKKRRGRLNTWENNVAVNNREKNTPLLRFRRNDWIKGKNEIHQSYAEGINKAENSIIIVASYFLPGNNFRHLLKKASARGVDIKIILAGKSDVSSVKLAQNYLYDFYLTNNIQLFEWQNSVLHGKAMLVDKTWATIGSYNLNFLSHYVSIELNVDIIDKKFIQKFSTHLHDILTTHCSLIELKKAVQNRNTPGRMMSWLAYNFYRILMAIVVTKRKHRRKK